MQTTSYQMIGRALMTVDELKSMPKGQFIVMKTGTHPMISKMKLYFKWGIRFEQPYIMKDKGSRRVSYLERDELMREVAVKYPQKKKVLPPPETTVEVVNEYEPEPEEVPKKGCHVKTGGA
ncbi:MAG: type IV secretory system conjugative DNA transfer family protein, partial [Oscillospiraceae bacterium]|nr:type IV secretory system conjugative DNA transfer family protein [Oscillospiraceae bacterium]